MDLSFKTHGAIEVYYSNPDFLNMPQHFNKRLVGFYAVPHGSKVTIEGRAYEFCAERFSHVSHEDTIKFTLLEGSFVNDGNGWKPCSGEQLIRCDL